MSKNENDDHTPDWLKRLTIPSACFQSKSSISSCQNIEPADFLLESPRADRSLEDLFDMALPTECEDSMPEDERCHPWPDDVPKVKASFPVLRFDGCLQYLTRKGEVEKWCSRIPRDAVLGFDTEWKAVRVKNAPPNKTALIQFCFRQKHTLTCLLIHISASGFTPALEAVLASQEIQKVGIGANGDAKKLREDYGVSTNGIVELQSVVNRKDLSQCIDPSVEYSKTEYSLAGLCERLIKRSMTKSQSVRCGNWEAFPLRPVQLRYAATDAYASLLCYESLMQLPDAHGLDTKQQTQQPSGLPSLIDDRLQIPEPEDVVAFVPVFRRQRQLCEDLQMVYNLFMGYERFHLRKHSIDEIVQLSGRPPDIIYCNLADAILSGQSYDWDRMEIKQSKAHDTAAGILQCLTSHFHWNMPHPNPLCIPGHPLASSKSNALNSNLLPMKLCVWHLSGLILQQNLAHWETAVVDVRLVLSNAGKEMQELISLFPEPLSYGMLCVTMAHVGRLVTDCIHRDFIGFNNPPL